MAASSFMLFVWFLLVSILLWLLFTFAGRLFGWILSRFVGVSVECRVGGWKCLRDIVVKLKKGAIESISIGEVRVSFRQSLVNLGVGFITRDPKLQVLICDLEVVMRPSSKSAKKTRSRSKGCTFGRGKWMVVANIARFLSISMTDLSVKTPKATIEVKEWRVGISKDGGSNPTLFVKLHLLPIIVQMGALVTNYGEGVSSGQTSFLLNETLMAPFRCEELFLSCEFDHDSEVGVIVKNVDIMSGEVIVNLNEELLRKKNSLDKVSTDKNTGSSVYSGDARRPHKKQQVFASLIKYTSFFPEKVLFLLPRLDLRFMHREHNLCIENNIMGIQLKSIKSRPSDDEGDNSRIDIQMDFSEIHLLREADTSVLKILKVDVISSIYVPLQESLPIRAEVDVNLGGTHCNIIMSRLKPWMSLHFSKKKRMVLREEPVTRERSQSNELKFILWSCTVAAPEMTLVVYCPSTLPLYHICMQSSHVSANNITTTGTTVHTELGALNLYMDKEYQECTKKGIFVVESNSGSLMHITNVSLDWGLKNIESSEVDGSSSKLVLSVNVTGMAVFLTFEHVESLVSTAMLFQALLKTLSAGKRKAQNHAECSSKPSGKGMQLLKVNLERCSINFCGKVGLDNAVVADPKRVNYGSQGGRVLINASADGTTRCANIVSNSENFKNLKYSVSLDIFNFIFCINKEKHSSQMELERAKSVYLEHLDEHGPGTKLTMFDMQNAKFVRRSGGHKDITICSLFSSTNITARWEPDVHLALFELVLQLKLLVHNQKLHGFGSDSVEDVPSMRDVEQKKEAIIDKQHKKKESIFAVDVEMLSISAEAGDGVEVVVQVQSIFSENARIGVLLEGLMLSFNGSRVFKSSRMQISRIPKASISSGVKLPTGFTWDWVIQALDVHICMPYRLQLRAIDDSIEDMIRGLKLITAAKSQLFSIKKESTKSKSPSSTKLGSVKFCIRKLTADIEEEPMQGWLDEHYKLLKNEACELAVRFKLFDEVIFKANQCPGTPETNDSSQERWSHYNGVAIDLRDPAATTKLQEDIYTQSFLSYYQACQNLKPSEGSGACMEGFQAGFKPSTARTSLLSISATELDVSLTAIEGGDAGMIEILKKLDPVCLENNIPFSRLLGRNILLHTGSLLVQIRDYTLPLFSATCGNCDGRIILAQQATYFQPQIVQDVFIGRWRKVCMLRSASGTTPPMKTYSDLPLHFQKAEVSFGVGFEPTFADISYAFTVALRRANLSIRNPLDVLQTQPPKKERSLPWWDDVRNYIHGNISIQFSETRWNVLATTDPYENLDKLQIISGYMEIQQSDGRVNLSAKEFKIMLSSLDGLVNNCNLKRPSGISSPFLDAPAFCLEVTMDWDCESGKPLDHYLFAVPSEGKTREKVFDPFRSTSLSLRWNFLLRPSLLSFKEQSLSSTRENSSVLAGNVDEAHGVYSVISKRSTTINVGSHDLAWIIKFWNMNYLPPHKLRAFSRWPRFCVPRVARSGNLSLDRVMTEFMLRLDATPTCIKHMHLDEDDLAKGLTFTMTKLKYELCFGRGKQKFTFECKRDPLDLVYQGIDLHFLKSYVNKVDCTSAEKDIEMSEKASQSSSMDRIPNEKCNDTGGCTVKHQDDGFFLSSDYFTIRKQTSKADPASLSAWQEAGKKNLDMTYVRSDFENGSESDDHTRSDRSDDDGYNVVIADNCQRVFVYGLKLLWTIGNRNAVWSWVGGVSKAFEPPKPSPCRQYAQRKLLEESQRLAGADKVEDDISKTQLTSEAVSFPSLQDVKALDSLSSLQLSTKAGSSTFTAVENNGNTNDSEEDGTRHFMVNVIEPQFNLHSEEANGRFLLAAASGRVLARSFHSVLHVGHELIEQALGTGNVYFPESEPQMTWKRMEFSVMLEHVQAHVAPTDVDPGAGLQWLPKIKRSSPKVKRTGALLERVFMPCDMYFRYTRHNGGTSDLKVKPLKELSFNSQNITATMTSRQFQVMLDVLTNLLFARLPKPRKSNFSYPGGFDENVEEEADEVVPDGVEEVELARVNLERKEREQKLLLDDIRKFSISIDTSTDQHRDIEDDLWTVTGGRSSLVQGLKKELVRVEKSRKSASASLRMALQKAAQLRLMEKEKNKSPSYAMRVSLQINKVVWGMLVDGKPIAEAEINDMIFDFDRDYKDVGVSQFTSKYFVLRNCLPNAKSDMVLSAWNPPPEWGKKVMLRIDAKQGAPKDGNSTLELFQVEIYPLKIHLTETMYRMMWVYFFPEDEQDSQRRQEVWKVSTTIGSKRAKAFPSSSQQAKESEILSKSSSHCADSSQAAKIPYPKSNIAGGSIPEPTSSFDRTWEETVAESLTNELTSQIQSSSIPSSKSGPLGSTEQHDEPSRNKLKDPKHVKSGRATHEDKKIGKSHDEKRSRPQKMMEFQKIKISQVELQVTYEGSRFVVNDLKLLMDTYHLVEFSGSWRKLISRVKKHVIWGVLKSVTGMQGKKFKDKSHSQREPRTTLVPESDMNWSDNECQAGKPVNYPVPWPKRSSDGAGDGFVNNVKGLFSSQRRKATAFVKRTMKGETDNEFHCEWSENDVENSMFARQLTISQAKKLIRRHTKKLRSKGQKGSSSKQPDTIGSSSKDPIAYESDSSSGSSISDDLHE